MASRSIGCCGRRWDRRIACLAGVTKPSEPSPLLPARSPMLTLNFSNAGAVVACRSKHQQFADNRESDLLLIGRFGSTAVSGSLSVVPRKRNPVIFEHVIHK